MKATTSSNIEQLQRLTNENNAAGILSMWTVYDHPSDYPNDYVARLFAIKPGGGTTPTTTIIVADNIAMLRYILQFELRLTCLQRAPSDDAKILETWL